jgi:uncharacterized protein DUF998
VRPLAAFGFAGQYLFPLFWLVGGLLQDGYSFRDQPISELGARTAEHPWIVQLGITVWGLSVLAVAAALWIAAEDFPGRRSARVAAGLIGLVGVVILVDGFIAPLDCMPNVDRVCDAREDAGDLSVRHYVHVWSGLVALPALFFSAVASALGFRRHPRLGFVTPLTVLALVVGAVVLFAFPEAKGHDIGLNQRLQIASFSYPLAFLAAVLFVTGPRLESRR